MALPPRGVRAGGRAGGSRGAGPRLTLARQAVFFALLVGILVSANWAPAEGGVWAVVFAAKWWLTAVAGGLLLLVLVGWLGLAPWKGLRL